MKTNLKGYLYVIISAVMFGCMPMGALWFYSKGGNAISLVFYRNLLPLPVLFLLGKMVHRVPMSITFKEGRQIFLLMLGYAGTPMLLFTSYNYVSSGMATTLHFVYPIVVLIACTLLFREPVNWIKGLCVALCTIGIFLFYTPDGEGNLLGMALALISGVTYAFYIVYLDKSGLKDMSHFKLSFYIALMSSIVVLIYNIADGSFVYQFTPRLWVFTFVFALCLSVLGVIPFQMGTRLIGAQRASILSTFEPITSIILGILFISEPFDLKTVFGVVCILTSVVLLTIFDRKEAAKVSPVEIQE